MTLKERAMEAIKACGIDCTYDDANAWLTKVYGKNHGVSNSVFYGARSVLRNGEKPQEVAVDQPIVTVSAPKTLTEHEVTFRELLAVAEFCENNGGRSRVVRVLGCLEELFGMT